MSAQSQAAVEVLICGAGAAGLTLGVELARRGIDFMLIDRGAGPFQGSRGKSVQPRTIEIFEDMGILDRVAASGRPYPPKRLYRGDGSHVDVPLVEPQAPTPAEPYGTPLLVPQYATEAALRARLLELGHHLHYGIELEGFDETPDLVRVHLRQATGPHSMTARYLVGTDGGRSTVRHLLGVEFAGRLLDAQALVADVTLTGLCQDAWHSFNEQSIDSLLALCPLPGQDMFSVLAPVPLDTAPDLSLGGLNALVARRSGRDDIRVGAVRWASAFRMSARLAQHYRIRRVFLAGDAAHIHPPAGGQGLNTSVQDAYNLGWKLAAALRHDDAARGDALLDSYEAERRPVGADMLALSMQLLEAARHGDFRRGRNVRQLDLAYSCSSAILDSRRSDSSVRPGQRAPDAPVTDATGQPVRLFTLFRGTHWTLLGQDTSRDQLDRLRRPGLHIFAFGHSGDLNDVDEHFAAAYGLRAAEAVLVRPDGYIGAIFDMSRPDTPDALSSYLHAVM